MRIETLSEVIQDQEIPALNVVPAEEEQDAEESLRNKGAIGVSL